MTTYSTRAQLSLEGKKVLADCPEGEDRMIEGFHKFKMMYTMAQEGEIWDVESLRQRLRELSPNSMPDSRGRVWQEE